MGGARATLAVVAAAMLAGCGATASEEGDFDPAAAERFILNKARADVRANPALLVKEPEEPTVECRELQPDRSETEQEARFDCEVRIVSEDGAPLGEQNWKAEVELDELTGDTVVRSSRRTATTITPAPTP
jgi:hypothetical protein